MGSAVRLIRVRLKVLAHLQRKLHKRFVSLFPDFFPDVQKARAQLRERRGQRTSEILRTQRRADPTLDRSSLERMACSSALTSPGIAPLRRCDQRAKSPSTRSNDDNIGGRNPSFPIAVDGRPSIALMARKPSSNSSLVSRRIVGASPFLESALCRRRVLGRTCPRLSCDFAS